MPTLTTTGTRKLKLNKLTKTQMDAVVNPSSTELYCVDPEFVGNKLLASSLSGDIVETNIPSSLATVATTGSYNDLSDKPTIPSAQVNSDWAASSGVSEILNKPNLATVATSGSYTDLSNKPTIPDAQVQSDWTQTNSLSVDYIKNKPTIPTIDQTYDASSANAQSGVAIEGAGFVKNTATGTGSLTALGTPTSYNYSLNVGFNSSVNAQQAVSIGYEATVQSGSSSGVAIGNQAVSYAAGAIQIGKGTNYYSNTLSVGLGQNNYQLLNSSGNVPVARYIDMVGADGANAGVKGVVPAPTATDNVNFLRGDGTWQQPELDKITSAGDGIKFLPGNSYTKVGTDVSVINGIASGFTTTSYLQATQSPLTNAGTITSFDIVTKISTDTTTPAGTILFQQFTSTSTLPFFRLQAGQNRTLIAIVTGMTTSPVTLTATSATGTVAVSSSIWIKASWATGGALYLYTSTDGTTWTQAAASSSTATSLRIPTEGLPDLFMIGAQTLNGTTLALANTSVDLSQTSVSINGAKVWQAYYGESGSIAADIVTSVSSSSTDSQIPSAKLFYDTCGNITALINAL